MLGTDIQKYRDSLPPSKRGRPSTSEKVCATVLQVINKKKNYTDVLYCGLCIFVYCRKQLLKRWIGEGNMMNSSTVSGQPGKSMKLLKLVSFILVFYPQIITNFFLRWSSPHLPAFGAQPRLCAVSLLQEAVPGVSGRETHPLL